MKKFVSVLIAMMMFLSCAACAEDASAIVFVSISDDAGQLVLAHVPVIADDTDGDGVFSIYDALVAAHIQYHPDGAAAFVAEKTEWGLSMYKLWGVENGGSYGYYLNDVSPMSMADPVKEGDHVKAYAFMDLNNFSDVYTYFAAPVAAAGVNEEITLTLSAAAFDENWAPIVVPVAGAVITVNGEKTDVMTDENGQAVLTFAAMGEYTVSAVSDTQTLVPPVCVATVLEW